MLPLRLPSGIRHAVMGVAEQLQEPPGNGALMLQGGCGCEQPAAGNGTTGW